jgi:ADP-heptose:LPS heptosyltransferase
MKTCLAIRHAAFGDGVMVSCALPYLHRDGYEITFLANDRVREALDQNPYIKTWVKHEDGSIPNDELEQYWEGLGKGFDKIVNFTGTVENELLFAYPQPEYFLTHKERRDIVNNRNYFESHVLRAGYKISIPPNAEIYFNKEERSKGRRWRNKHRKQFKIAWTLAGSSNHKIYRYFEPLMIEFLTKYSNAELYTLGDYPTRLLTFEHPRVHNMMMVDNFGLRDSLLLAKNSNLVIGPETGVLVAASGWIIPKICLLSHSSKENLTKHWLNTYSIKPECDCSPCHMLFKYKDIWKDKCQIDSKLGTPKCTEHKQETILDIMENEYAKWKSGFRS